MNSTIEPLTHHAESHRSIAEISIKALTSYFVTTIACRCLAALRGQPSNFATYQVLASVLIPTYPLAELIVGIYRTFKTRRRAGGRGGQRYYFCSSLDMRAVEDSESEEDSIPLALVDPDNIHPTQQPCDARWAAILLLLLVLALQAIFTIWLWIRRSANGSLSVVDDVVMVNSMGCLIAALMGIAIISLNIRWHLSKSPNLKAKKNFDEPTKEDLFIQMLLGPTLIELRLAILLAILARLGLHYLPANHSMPTELVWPVPTGRLMSNEAEFLVSAFATCGSWFMAYTLAWFSLVVIYLSVRFGLSQGRLSPYLRGTFYDRTLQVCSILYIFMSGGLLAIAVWNVVNAKPWEPWMWRDPWSVWFLV